MKTAFRALTLLCFVLVPCSLVHAQAMPAASRPFTLSAFGAATRHLHRPRRRQESRHHRRRRHRLQTLPLLLSLRSKFAEPTPSTMARSTPRRTSSSVARWSATSETSTPTSISSTAAARSTTSMVVIPIPPARCCILTPSPTSSPPGGGLDFTLTDHFALKIRRPVQHYGSPVTTSGSL